MYLQKSLLEDWMRDYYFSVRFDLGSSGVKNYSLKELFDIIGLKFNILENIKFNDSETYGNYELRQCIADLWGDGDSSSVLVGNGSNEVIYQLLNSILSKGDEVIVLRPIYHALGKLADSICGNVKEWILDPTNNFQPNMDDLKKIISSKTRMVIVNFPHNPTGVSISRKQLDELINIVSEVDSYLFWDAAFQDILFNSESLANPYLRYKKTIYVGTVSKCYGLAGLRLGWCIAFPKVIKSCQLIKDYTSLYVSPLNEFIGIQVINNMDKIISNIIPDVIKNYQTLSQWITSHSEFIGGVLPQGGVSAFLKLLNSQDSFKVCKTLAKDKKLLLIPGECFDSPGYFRIGFGSSCVEFEEGLKILSAFIRSL